MRLALPVSPQPRVASRRPASAPRHSVRVTAMASSPVKYGVVGLGIMGTPIARNLMKLGHPVVVWNRNADKAAPLLAEGATLGKTPAEVVAQCDITFAMLSDPEAAEAVALGPGGVVEGLTPGKSYVDMSTVDADTSRRIAAAVQAKGGRFLEAPVSGSKQPAIDGQLIILAAGDESLYNDCAAAWSVLSKKAVYLGATGAGAQMKLVVNMVMGSMMTSLSEGLALAQASGLDATALLQVLDAGAIANPMFRMKGPAMATGGPFPPAFPLKHQQKDMRLALLLGDSLGVSMPVAAAANEAFKRARADGHGDEDFAAVHASAAKPK